MKMLTDPLSELRLLFHRGLRLAVDTGVQQKATKASQRIRCPHGIYEKERCHFYYLEIVGCFYTTNISRIHYYVMANICHSAPPAGGRGDCSGLAPSVWLGAGAWKVSPPPPQGSPWRPRWVTGLSPLLRSPPSFTVSQRGRISCCVPGRLSRAGRQEG